jgi:hypothetical protein
MGLAEQRLADDRGAHPGLTGGDRRTQPGPAGADDHHVELVLLDVEHGAPS